jgi:hypothetical protein
MSRIEIRPQGGVQVEKYVETVMDMKEELSSDGVDVVTLRTRAEPVLTTILVSIVGSVLSHFIIKLADRLMKKKEEEKDNVQIVIVVQQQRFELPAGYSRLRERLALAPVGAEQPAEEPRDDRP